MEESQFKIVSFNIFAISSPNYYRNCSMVKSFILQLNGTQTNSAKLKLQVLKKVSRVGIA